MKIIILLMALISSSVMADSAYIGGWSHHFNEPKDDLVDINERHNLTAYERNNYIIGRFKNSYSDETIFAAYNFKAEVWMLELGVMTGVMHGYNPKDSPLLNFNKFQPMIVPHATLNTDLFIKPTVLILGGAIAITLRLDF